MEPLSIGTSGGFARIGLANRPPRIGTPPSTVGRMRAIADPQSGFTGSPNPNPTTIGSPRDFGGGGGGGGGVRRPISVRAGIATNRGSTPGRGIRLPRSIDNSLLRAGDLMTRADNAINRAVLGKAAQPPAQVPARPQIGRPAIADPTTITAPKVKPAPRPGAPIPATGGGLAFPSEIVAPSPQAQAERQRAIGTPVTTDQAKRRRRRCGPCDFGSEFAADGSRCGLRSADDRPGGCNPRKL